MKSIDDFNNKNTENLENESVEDVNQIPVVKSEDIVDEYKTKEVKVLSYNKDSKLIIFDLDDAKIQTPFDGNVNASITVEYKGTVGTSDFAVKIK